MTQCDCDCGCEADGEWHFDARCACVALGCPCALDAHTVLTACDWYGIGKTARVAVSAYLAERPAEGDDE